MSETAIREAHAAFGKMVSDQMARIAGEIKRLGEVMKAGQVDPRVLREFHEAADRLQACGWHVQVWLEGGEPALSGVLTEERARRGTLTRSFAAGMEAPATKRDEVL